jgi:hypothetical protein
MFGVALMLAGFLMAGTLEKGRRAAKKVREARESDTRD